MSRRRHVSLLLAACLAVLPALGGCTGGEETPAQAATAVGCDVAALAAPLAADAAEVLDAAAAAMAEVRRVRFDLVPSGATVHIDAFGAIALREVSGQVAVDEAAAAVLGVQVQESLNTELAAVAVGSEVLVTNPVTGRYEEPPPGIDIDPSQFFDPAGGWRPLLAELQDAELVGTERRGSGERHHLRGTAPAERIEAITAGLVSGQPVDMDFWIDPATGLVTAAEFAAEVPDGEATWTLELAGYGCDVDIDIPDELRVEGG